MVAAELACLDGPQVNDTIATGDTFQPMRSLRDMAMRRLPKLPWARLVARLIQGVELYWWRLAVIGLP